MPRKVPAALKQDDAAPRRRNRAMGPTQIKVLTALKEHSEGASRLDLAAHTGLTPEQVISGLRGLLKRGKATRRKEAEHKTAKCIWFVA